MKKVLLSIMMLMAAMTVGAQDGRWEKHAVEGDELKGIEPTTAYVYVQEGMGGFVFWHNDDSRFCIISPKVMFNTTVSNGDTGTLALVGFYDNDGNMKEKINLWLTLDTNSGYHKLFAIDWNNNPLIKNHKKNIKKVLEAVKQGDGYVRILTGRYQTDDFDLKIPPFKE